MLKGVALTLMLAHHLFAFPDRIPSDLQPVVFAIRGVDVFKDIGIFAQFCVPLYMFLGGFGMYRMYVQERKDGEWQGTWNSLMKLFVKYWTVFLICIPICWIFFQNQVTLCQNEKFINRYKVFRVVELFRNWFGLSSSYNGEWWFFFSYLIVLAIFPILARIIKGRSFAFDVSAVVIFQIATTTLFRFVTAYAAEKKIGVSWLFRTFFLQNGNAACFFMGCVMAKTFRLEKLFAKYRAAVRTGVPIRIASVLGIVSIFYIRRYFVGADADIFYTPFFTMFCATLFERTGVVKKCVAFLGKHSTYMWLTHSFWCYYWGIFARMIYSLRWPPLILLATILVSLATSIILTNVFDKRLFAFAHRARKS